MKSTQAFLHALAPAEVSVLEQGGFALDGPDPGEDDPLARTAAEYAALLKTSLTTSTAAARLGVEASRIRQTSLPVVWKTRN